MSLIWVELHTLILMTGKVFISILYRVESQKIVYKTGNRNPTYVATCTP